jgi:hypothetical protein
MYTLREIIDINISFLTKEAQDYDSSLLRILRSTISTYLKLRLFIRTLAKQKGQIDSKMLRQAELLRKEIIDVLKVTLNVGNSLTRLIELSRSKDIVLDDRQRERLSIMYHIIDYSISICTLILNIALPREIKTPQLKDIAEEVYMDYSQIKKQLGSNNRFRRAIEFDISKVDPTSSKAIQQVQQKLY